MGKIADVHGQRFGRLIVTNLTRRFNGVTKRLCNCDCGNAAWITLTKLRNGHTSSCGCWVSEFRRLPAGRAAHNEVLDNYKRGATKRNLVWELSDDQFDKLVAARCYYCNRLPMTVRESRRNTGSFTYNGLDRMHNHIGYTVENTVTCCHICNRAKSDMTLEEFKKWINDLCEARSNEYE